MKVITVIQNQGAVEALKQALPADGATAMRIRRAMKPLSAALDDYKSLIEAKLKELGKTEVRSDDPEMPELEKYLNSALQEEIEGKIEAILTEADLEGLRVPRRNNTISGLSVFEINAIEALGLLMAGE
ncbi:MAG: hypothetical protein A2Y38_18530 [Spirochaetes bacterium GWB1_59_5]|nr:MAG: hypothetical protein A2Y38_18530 [Spirochaetes bacterium GWB1_59_5]